MSGARRQRNGANLCLGNVARVREAQQTCGITLPDVLQRVAGGYILEDTTQEQVLALVPGGAWVWRIL